MRDKETRKWMKRSKSEVASIKYIIIIIKKMKQKYQLH